MSDEENGRGITSRRAWNSGRAVGQKHAFSIGEARRLKELLFERGKRRDLALAAVAFDSSLRSCDLLRLRRRDLVNEAGGVRRRVTVRQMKTRANVTFELSAATRACLERQLATHGSEWIFPGRAGEEPLGCRQYRRLVKTWAKALELDADRYGTHSLRRTRPAAVYEMTRDAEVARILLGQQSLLATHRYLGIGQEAALERAREVEI